MKRTGIVISAWMLILILLCQSTLLSLPVAAEEGSSFWDWLVGTRADPSFMGQVFYGSDGSFHQVDQDGNLVLPMGTDSAVGYLADVAPVTYDIPNNAIRFVMTNYSDADHFRLQYTWRTQDGTETDNMRIQVEPYSGRCTYIVRLDVVDQLVDIMLTLPNIGGTSMVFHAMEAVNVFSEEPGEYGTLSDCIYSDTTKTVTVKGSVYHDVMIAAGGGQLGLFRLAPDQTMEQLINDPSTQPLVTSSLSIGFQLQTPAGDVSSRYARYAVLICMPDGTRLPLGYARYATARYPQARISGDRADFKGIDTTLTSGAIDSNVGSAIVDVYLNRLENDQQSGYLYTADDQYFYFNRAYLAELDATIRSLSGAACRVYLRFLVEGEDSVRYHALRTDSEESLRRLYAYTSFLCSRYQGGGQGEISGIILGSHVDRASLYHATAQLSLSEYVTMYGQALSLVSLAAGDIDPSLAMIVPVSNGWNADSIGSATLSGDYLPELFLESLAAYLTSCGARGFYPMIESSHNPYGLDNAYFEPINTDGDDSLLEGQTRKLTAADQSSPYLSSENIILLDNYLKQYCARYPVLSNFYLFHWTPDADTGGNALSASYIYHYYRLFADPQAVAFFVSFRDKELAGNMTEFSKIKYLVKYIDTPGGIERTAFALDIFKAPHWNALVLNFDQEATEHMTMIDGVFREYDEAGVVGSYPLFDFTTANSVRGWYAGNYCQKLSVVTSERYGKTLDAVMRADLSTLAEYSDIAYEFDSPMTLQYSDALRLTVSVDSPLDEGSVFEVKLVVGSNEGYLEAKQVVKNGETVTLTLDSAAFAAVSDMEYLRLSAKTVMGSDETFTLHLHSLSLDSQEHDTAVLAAIVKAAARGDYSTGADDEKKTNYVLPIITVSAALVGTLMVAMVLGHYQKNDHDREGEDES